MCLRRSLRRPSTLLDATTRPCRAPEPPSLRRSGLARTHGAAARSDGERERHSVRYKTGGAASRGDVAHSPALCSWQRVPCRFADGCINARQRALRRRCASARAARLVRSARRECATRRFASPLRRLAALLAARRTRRTRRSLAPRAACAVRCRHGRGASRVAECVAGVHCAGAPLSQRPHSPGHAAPHCPRLMPPIAGVCAGFHGG